MKLLLVKDDLWDVIPDVLPAESDVAWIKRNRKARALIWLMEGDNQFDHIKMAKIREAWNYLINYDEKGLLPNEVYL